MKYYLLNTRYERIKEFTKEEAENYLGEKSISSLEDILNRAYTQNETGTSLDRKGSQKILVKKLRVLHRKGDCAAQNEYGFIYYYVKGNSKQRLSRQDAVTQAGRLTIAEFSRNVKPKETTRYTYDNVEFALINKQLNQASQ